MSNMRVAFCIGNGESRRHFDLNRLRNQGPIAGCNALYRDFEPTFLVAVDSGMCAEVQRSGYTGKILTIRKDHAKKQYWLVDVITEEKICTQQPIWASGPWSVLAMVRLYPKVEEVFFLGHDFHGCMNSGENLHNNLYKGTKNYDVVDCDAKNPLSWIQQIAHVVINHPGIHFTRVGPVPYLVGIDEWVGAFSGLVEQPNFGCIEYQDFYKCLESSFSIAPANR